MTSLWRALCLMVLLLVSLALLAPFSDWGSRRVLSVLEAYLPLEVDYRAGSIATQLELDRLSYSRGGVRIEATDVVSRLKLACLWRSAVCFERLQAASLDLELSATDADVPPEAPLPETAEKALLAFPVALETDDLRIASTRITWSGGEWRQGMAHLALSLRDSSIVVTEAIIDSTLLELRTTEAETTERRERIVLPVVDLPLELSVDELTLRSPRWDIYGLLQAQDELRLKGYWRNRHLHLEELSSSQASRGSLSLRGDIEFSGDWPLQIASEFAASPTSEFGRYHPDSVALELSGDLGELEIAARTGERPRLTLAATVSLLEPQLPFSAVLEATGGESLALDEWVELPAQLEGAVLNLPWRAEASGNLEQQDIQLDGGVTGPAYGALSVAVTARHRDGELSIAGVELSDEEGYNRLLGRGSLVTGDSPVISLVLESPGINLPQVNALPTGRLRGRLAMRLLAGAEAWQVLFSGIDLQGDVNGLPASVAGSLALDQSWSLRGTSLEMELNGATASLRGSADGVAPATLDLSIADLGRWHSGASGRLQLDATVKPGWREVQFEGVLEALHWGALETGSALLSGRYLAARNGEFDVALRSESVEFSSLALSEFYLTARGDRSAQRVGLSVAGDLSGELRLEGTGWDTAWRGELSPAQLATRQGTWRLERAVPMEWQAAASQLALVSHCWRHDRASVCVENILLGREGGIGISAEGDLANFDGLLPTGMTLQGQLELALAGQWAQDTGVLFDGVVEADKVIVTRYYGDGESASANWERARAALRYDSNGLSLQSTLDRQQRRVLALDLLLPASADGQMTGTLALERMKMAPLIAFAPALASLEGELSGQLQLDGTLEAPLATGYLQLSDAGVGLIGNPTPLESLQVTLQLRGARAIVTGAGLLGGGPVQLQGELRLQPELSLSLQIEGDQQNILYPPATEMIVSERLQLEAAPGLLSLSGDITVHEGSLEPEILPEGSVAVSSDVVEVDYQGNIIRRRLPFDISVDVHVRVEDRFRVRSSLLVATLGGKLHVLQAPGKPLQLFGSLSVVDGEVRAYQQQLRIQRGALTFSGSPDNPAINVRAIRNISGSNVTAGIQVRGRYDALELEVFSEPAMSQGEAMSYLIRGRGVDASAGEDGTALALSVTSGVVNQSTLVSELNRIPGVSNVSFGAEGSAEDTAATVSGYIGERIYLSYGIGVYEPINVLIARIYLYTHLWLEVVSRLENSVDLYYAFDID